MPGSGGRADTISCERVQEGGERLARVGLDPHRDGIDAADVPAVDVDLDDRRPRLDVAPVVEAGELPEPRAHDQQEVGPAARLGRLGGARPTERAHVERIVVGHGVVPAIRRDDRHPVAGGETGDEIRGRRPRHAAPGDEERALGPREEARGLADRLRMGRRRVSRAVRLGGEGLHPHDLVVQHVPRDVDEHRSPAPRHRGAKREPEHVRDPSRLGHLDRQLRHRPEERHQVELLEGVPPLQSERRAAGDRHDGRVRHVGSRDAGDEVRRAGSARHQAHGRHAGDPRETVGHEGAALLVTDVHVLHALVVVEDVQHVEEGRADDPEDVPHPLGLQELDDGPAGAHLGHGRGSRVAPSRRQVETLGPAVSRLVAEQRLRAGPRS